MDVHLIEEKDTFKLNLTESGQFLVNLFTLNCYMETQNFLGNTYESLK
jgi:hypothetical protein